jgi:hypothetical protein
MTVQAQGKFHEYFAEFSGQASKALMCIGRQLRRAMMDSVGPVVTNATP